MMEKIDKADRLLLNQLQKDAETSINELAEISHLSTASVNRRIRKFKKAGIIKRRVDVLDASQLQKGMTFVVLVEMERERSEQLDAFKRTALKEEAVQQCYYITGEADFALICLTKDIVEYEELSKRLFFDNNNIRRFRTSVVMGKSKATLEVPLL